MMMDSIKTHRSEERAGREAGFSLIELLVAIVIAGIGLSALAQVFPRAGRGLGESRRSTESTLCGQEKFESLKALAFDDAALASGAHTDTTLVADASFTRKWTVEVDKPMSGMRRIRILTMRTGEDTLKAVELTGVLGRK
jgi:prepilin-type N-terminal cleavage/methylation domain-containing protein